ncbi:YDG domain-containing protein [Salix suchowensis]|nr:YDG domain-containing protein [Salix suchowensis]
MDEISTSALCSSKFKRRRVDAVREFPRVCGIFPVVMGSRDGNQDYIVDHVQPPQNLVTQAARRKYPPPRILKGSAVRRDFPSGFRRQDSTQLPKSKASAETDVKKSPPPGSTLTDFSARPVKNATAVADFRSMRSDLTLGKKETDGLDRRGQSASYDKVKDVLRLFHLTLAELLKENAAKPKMEKKYNVPRQAAMFLKDHRKWINTSKRWFRFQAELNVIGLHCNFQNGIDYMKKNGISLATSIVVSERYANNMESPGVLIYSGHGGNPTVRGGQAIKDQKLELGNLALKHCMDSKTPVRVIYKVKLKSSKIFSLKGTGWRRNLNPIFVYDGLYTVEEFWEERGEFGKLVFKFKLRRNLDQPRLLKCWRNLLSR